MNRYKTFIKGLK